RTLAHGIDVIFLAMYLISGREREQGALFALVPRRYHVRLARIIMNLETIVGGYVRGQVITSILMTIFTFILLSIFGVQGSLALAVFAGLTDILPFIGGLLAGAPAGPAARGVRPPAPARALLPRV